MPYPATPEFHEQIADLVVNEHTQLEGEPLLLAIYYASALAPKDECLFEVISDFGYDEVSQDRRIFQVQYGPTPNFPIPEAQYLRLVLTNPVECETAIQQNWEEIRDVREALQSGRGEVIYRDIRDARAAHLLAALEDQRVAA